MFRKLICDWFLTDDIRPAIRLDSPMYAEDALCASGAIPSESDCEKHCAVEWIYRRRWRYYTSFKSPAKDERLFLRISALNGVHSVYINSALAAQGDSLSEEFEITALNQPENLLEIVFEPDLSRIRPVTGFAGMVSYKCSRALAITDLRPADDWQLATNLDAAEDCDCALVYCLKNSAGTHEARMEQMLQAGFNSIRFEGLSEFLLIGAVNEIELKAYLGDELSDTRTLTAFLPEAHLLPRGFAGQSERILSLGEAANAISAFSPKGEPSPAFRLMASRYRLEALSAEDFEAHSADAALMPYDELMQIAVSEDRLYKREMWLLSGADADCFDKFLKRVPSGDTEKIIALSRYEQAMNLRAAAFHARLNGECFALSDIEPTAGEPASKALIDLSGTPRPAYYALAGAWQSNSAYVNVGDDTDGIVNCDVIFVCDSVISPIDAVSVGVYDMNGERIAANSFPAMSAGRIGSFTFELPQDGCAILRANLVKGEESRFSSDTAVFRQDINIEQLPQTQLLAEDGSIKNAGQCAALGVCVQGANYFGCLLPGESVKIVGGDPDVAEGLNIYM